MSAHRPLQKWNDLRYKYKMTRHAYESLVEKQDRKCRICGGIPAKLNVDHDHACCPGRKTCGKCVRGLLCKNCNTTLGHVEDDLKKIVSETNADWAVAAVRYLGRAA